jgi:glucokinase
VILGIDVGGTKTAFAVARDNGQLIARSRHPTQPSGDPDADLSRLIGHARALLAEAGEGAGPLRGVGVALPGPLDSASGTVHSPPNLLGWKDVPVGSMLEDVLQAPVRIENDANAAALAEWRFGAGQGLTDLVYLTMSTGVGGGMILDGRLYRGPHGSAGEWGHVPIALEGLRCACGLSGCLEAYVGGAAWQRWLRAEIPEASLAVRLAGERATLRPEHVVEAAHRGDAMATDQVARWTDLLAHGLAQIAFSLAPQAIILGTIAVAAGESLCFGPQREILRRRLWTHQAPQLTLLPAALGQEGPYLAGICVALEGLEQG